MIRLRRRIRFGIAVFVVGLVLSGVTAIPLQTEVTWLVKVTGARQLVETPAPTTAPAWAAWLMKVEAALGEMNQKFPFFGYGGDWLAFGHFVIALAFVGAWRDPVRNRWLFDFGLLACALVIPYALVLGQLRGIPIWWRLLDCSFGILGAIPLWVCRRYARELELPQAT
jgi:hypothetical protein